MPTKMGSAFRKYTDDTNCRPSSWVPGRPGAMTVNFSFSFSLREGGHNPRGLRIAAQEEYGRALSRPEVVNLLPLDSYRAGQQNIYSAQEP